jgi:hypothetical protein
VAYDPIRTIFGSLAALADLKSKASVDQIVLTTIQKDFTIGVLRRQTIRTRHTLGQSPHPFFVDCVTQNNLHDLLHGIQDIFLNRGIQIGCGGPSWQCQQRSNVSTATSSLEPDEAFAIPALFPRIPFLLPVLPASRKIKAAR